jgi:rhodanese-related sulfurtransferase
MIKQIKSSDIKKFIQDNPNTVLLDVRTEDEWNTVGKPETKDLGIKSYFITISQDPSFLENIKKEINKDKQILVM